MDTVRHIPLERICTDGLQTRSEIRQATVEDYAQVLRDGAALPPAIVYDDGARLHLAAGFHRMAAYETIGREDMPCIVRKGTAWDAIQAGILDNQKHLGERLTRKDRRHAAEVVLRAQPRMSDRAVADLVGVSAATVAAVRAELVSTAQVEQSTTRIGRDGRTVDTSNIGSKSTSVEHSAGTGVVAGRVAEVKPVDEPSTTAAAGGCRCGGEWTSDGEGGRFCESCGANHHSTPSVPFEQEEDKEVQASVVESPAGRSPAPAESSMSDEAAARSFGEVRRYMGECKRRLDGLSMARPGPYYERAMSFLDNASDVVSAWVHFEGLDAVTGGRAS